MPLNNAVQCVLYYTRNRTLLLGTSLYKPYCSEVHLLNQQYPKIWPPVSCIHHYPLSTSEYEWSSNIGYILFPTLILTPRYTGTLFAYHDGNPVKIFKRILILLSSHVIPQGGTTQALIIIMTLTKWSKNSKKGPVLRRDIMVVHFKISTYFIFGFMYGRYLGNFDNL